VDPIREPGAASIAVQNLDGIRDLTGGVLFFKLRRKDVGSSLRQGLLRLRSAPGRGWHLAHRIPALGHFVGGGSADARWAKIANALTVGREPWFAPGESDGVAFADGSKIGGRPGKL
jgi:hypothetical protein